MANTKRENPRTSAPDDARVRIERWDETLDGPLTEAALGRKIERWGYMVSRYVYPPGTSFPEHTHGQDKVDGVLSGRFRMHMDNQTVELTAGDCLFVPAGKRHSAEVVGAEAVVSLDAVKMASGRVEMRGIENPKRSENGRARR